MKWKNTRSSGKTLGVAPLVIRRRREAAKISASMKTFYCYDIVRQFYRTDMASLAWLTSRVAETCYENVWTITGFCETKNLPRSLSRHARSKNHIQNQIALTSGRARIDFGFERTAETKYISVHNAEVRENRKILKDLINVNCYLAKQKLAFRSNDESSTSSYRGSYVELYILVLRKMKD